MALKWLSRPPDAHCERPRADGRIRWSDDAASQLLSHVPASTRHMAETVNEHIRDGRFRRSLALVAGLSSVLSGLEVVSEHYRGSYSQRIMYSPVILSPLLLLAGVREAAVPKGGRALLPLVSLATIVDGGVGFAFHVRGVHRKPGGWRIPVSDVIMGPPIFAPLLFAVSGYLGLTASMLRREEDTAQEVPRPSSREHLPGLRSLPGSLEEWVGALERDAREGRLQQQFAAAAAISSVFSGVEALYSHYKNNFQYKVQWTPILLTPLVTAAGLGAVWHRGIARTALPAMSLLALLDGLVGSFYHARGLRRRPGGLKMPLYNLMYGPPLFAPMLFSASGFLGLLASLLRRSE